MSTKKGSGFIAVTVLTVAACSGGSTKVRSSDAGTDAGTDAGADAQVDEKPIDFFTYLPAVDAGPAAVACMGCFKNQCGSEMNACANSANCREGLACAFGQCSVWTGALSGSISSGMSSADLTCISTCFKGDLTAALLASKSATCATTACRQQCESVLPRDGGADVIPPADRAIPTGLDGSSPNTPVLDASSQDVALPGAGDVAEQSDLQARRDGGDPSVDGVQPSVDVSSPG